MPYLNRDDVRWGMLATAGLWSGQIADTSQRDADEMVKDFDVPLLHVHTDNGYDPSLDEIVQWVISNTR